MVGYNNPGVVGHLGPAVDNGVGIPLNTSVFVAVYHATNTPYSSGARFWEASAGSLAVTQNLKQNKNKMIAKGLCFIWVYKTGR